jgi:hypothetical protein
MATIIDTSPHVAAHVPAHYWSNMLMRNKHQKIAAG